MGPGMGRGPGAFAAPPGDARPLGDEVKAGLVRALQAEYEAEALYDGIVASVGRDTPATPIARSERRHAWVLESLLVAHGAEVPASAATKSSPFASKSVACTAGVASEKKTVALYDDLLGRSPPPDVKRVYEHLRAQSTHHLAAFERCATGK